MTKTDPLFQSTPPAREETCRKRWRAACGSYFNPLLPHGRRRLARAGTFPCWRISIHSSRTGGDGRSGKCSTSSGLFQSTPPAREETRAAASSNSFWVFQSTPPAREETRQAAAFALSSAFQSTPPAREETSVRRPRSSCPPHFNPLLPHGRRLDRQEKAVRCTDFNPLLPHGRRLYPSVSTRLKLMISIHSSRTGGDGRVSAGQRAGRISIHSSRTGGDTVALLPKCCLKAISIHSSRTGGDPALPASPTG